MLGLRRTHAVQDHLSLRHRMGLLGCPVQNQEWGMMILASFFQLKVFYGSMIQFFMELIAEREK